ncbi:MAG: hypothetical protein ACTTKP_04990 [Catonella sp.]|uniref:hypothetical protein n=1 Tax=Catonella sp. TaxID=2382125 RepID=UPI003FA0228B
MEIVGILLIGLKIIGLALLGLLLILLAIILLFLFIPFTYKFSLKYTDKQFGIKGEISFLFRFIWAGFSYENELFYSVKTAFFTLASDDRQMKKTEAVSNQPVKVEEGEAVQGELGKKSEIKNTDEIKAENDLKEAVEVRIEEENPKEEKPKEEKKETNKLKKRKTALFSKMKHKIKRIKTKWKVFKERLKGINLKKEAIIHFLNSEGTLDGAWYLFTQGKRLIKMVCPKRIKGWLRFGTGDVYTEGQYLSYLCLIYPFLGRQFEIIPEWDEEVIETDVFFSGRITLFIIILVILKVLFSKRVKLLRKNFNRCKIIFEKN